MNSCDQTRDRTVTSPAAVDLRKFCGDDWPSTHLSKPFSRGEYSLATNGKIAIRVPRRPDIPETDKAPHIERIWPDALTNLVVIKPFQLPAPVKVACDDCQGCGDMRVGRRSVLPCDNCNGLGRVDELTATAVGKHDIPTEFARLMLELPGLAIARAINEILPFRFDGGDGLVSILRPGHERRVVADLMKPDDV